MRFRVYVEKREGFDREARELLKAARETLSLDVENIRILNRYDVENVPHAMLKKMLQVFAEPQTDTVSEFIDLAGARVFAMRPRTEDARGEAAEQCIRFLAPDLDPAVHTAKVYAVYGAGEKELAAIKHHLLRSSEVCEARLSLSEGEEAVAVPKEKNIEGFSELDESGLAELAKREALGMEGADLAFCRAYFGAERREPTRTELQVIDAFWAQNPLKAPLEGVTFEDEQLAKAYSQYLAAREELHETGPVTMEDLATVALRLLQSRGLLNYGGGGLRVKATVDGAPQEYLLFLESAAHIGEGGAIGEAVRGVLSDGGYAYCAVRVSGTKNPLLMKNDGGMSAISPQKLAADCASYTNQMGLMTGLIGEVYHDGYELPSESAAVLGAAPIDAVRREAPTAGDKVILLGSKETSFPQGNPTEVRKFQRFMRGRAAGLIKACRDCSAGVAVAIGSLASGLDVDLSRIPVTNHLNGDIALAPLPERMAAVVAAPHVEEFLRLAGEEDLEAAVVATVTSLRRLRMRQDGRMVVDLAHELLQRGACRAKTLTPIQIEAHIPKTPNSFPEGMRALASNGNVCSARGLIERFDGTAGAGSVLLPLGGAYQRTPTQAAVTLLPVAGHTEDVSFLSWGGSPSVAQANPYRGGYLAVVESLAKLIATGASFEEIALNLQVSYKNAEDGPALSALLGAFKAQCDYGVGAVKTVFTEAHEIPPAAYAFAWTAGRAQEAVSPEFKAAGHRVALLAPRSEHGLPVPQSQIVVFRTVTALLRSKKAVSAWAVGANGIAEAVLKMGFGNKIGFRFSDMVPTNSLFQPNYGSFLIELTGEEEVGEVLGITTGEPSLVRGLDTLSLSELGSLYEEKLESVYPTAASARGHAENFTYEGSCTLVSQTKFAVPRVLIPVFTGTNCEYETARAFTDAGAEVETFVVRSRIQDATQSKEFARQVQNAQIVFLPGGFSGGDEPDGSGKYIASFFRSGWVREAVDQFLTHRDGLMGGICNGFQALIKLGLVPFGSIQKADATFPTLTHNAIGRHQSHIVRVRVCSVKSPWLNEAALGEVYSVPISHGEGRLVCSESLIRTLAENGQVMTQYVDFSDRASMDIAFNPSESGYAVEGLLSPDGRVFGRMGHAERKGSLLYKNVSGNYDMRLFESAVKYFK